MKNIFEDKILYIDEHLSCNQYMHDVTYGFSIKNIEAGLYQDVKVLPKNTIVFLLEGRIILSYKRFKDVVVDKNSFIFLPKGANISYKIKQNVTAIFFTFETLLSVCDQNLLQSYTKHFDNMTFKFTPLRMNDAIIQYINALKYCLDRKMNCMHFHELKHKEFFMYLRCFYTKEEIGNFLYPIIGVKPDFKQFIINNWKIGMSVNDIIAMMPMSKSTFIRTFDQNFSMTPYAWYQKNVCEKIVQKAISPDSTIKDLMNIAHITDASLFNRFCRRNFNCTPKMLLEHYSKIND